jgi:outer membrane lipoprotein carrier protein
MFELSVIKGRSDPVVERHFTMVVGMSLIRYTLISLLLWTTASAQERAFECANKGDLSASEGAGVVDRVQTKYAGLTGLRAKFYQHSFLAAMEASELSSGEVWFLKPGMMKWHYLEPEEQIFWVKDGVLWLYQRAENQAIINDFQKMLITDLPVAFLMGLGDLQRDFALKRACRGVDGVVLDMVSAKQSKRGPEGEGLDELAGFKLLIDPLSSFPKGAQVVHVGGNTTSIILGQIEFGLKLEPAFFEPEIPKGADINDMRAKP